MIVWIFGHSNIEGNEKTTEEANIFKKNQIQKLI